MVIQLGVSQFNFPGVASLKLTANAPENGGFQARNLRDSSGLFSAAMLVSGRVVLNIIIERFGLSF